VYRLKALKHKFAEPLQRQGKDRVLEEKQDPVTKYLSYTKIFQWVPGASLRQGLAKGQPCLSITLP